MKSVPPALAGGLTRVKTFKARPRIAKRSSLSLFRPRYQLLSENEADTDAEVVLSFSAETSRIVIKLNRTEVDALINPDVHAAADDTRKTGFAIANEAADARISKPGHQM